MHIKVVFVFISVLAYFLSGSDIHSGQSLSARENRLSGHENSFKLTLVQDYSLGVQLNRHERKQLLSNQVFIPASIRGDSMDLQGDEENNKSLATTEAEIEQDQNSSLAFSESSRETNTYTAVSSESDKSSNSSMKSALSVEEFPQFTTLTSDGSLSNCNDSSLLSSSFGETTMVADSSCTLQSSSDFVDSRDRAIRTVHSGTSADTGRDSSDSFVCETFGTQSGANGGNLPLTQQGTSSTAGRVLRTPSSAETDWEHLGARPKEVQRSDVEPEPTAPVFYITDGLAGDFLARHTQDKSLQDSIYQTDGVSLFNDIPLQGTSFIDGDISQFSKAQTYFGDCQAASGTEPYGGTRNPLIIGSNRHFGGPSYAEPFSDNSGLWPSHLGNGSFSLYSNFLSRNTSATANNYSPQSDFARSSSRFARVDHFDGEPYLPSAQQVPYPPTSSDSVLNSYPGMTGSSFADPSWTGAALTLPGDPVHNVPRFSSFLSEQLTDPAHDANRFVGNDGTSAFISNQGTDEPAEKTNLALGNSRTTTGNIDNEVNSSALYQLGTSTTFDSVLAVRSTHDTSVLEPRLGDTDNNGVCMLNKRDFDTDSLEASDNSLLALELRVAEACALVERVFREREEREQFEWEIERKEQLIREQRARERREREERELPEAENWPQQQEAIAARSQWVCEHYQRHCRVRFPCCTQFYPCHHCHNISKACDNEEAKACHATHLKCSHCQHEQKVIFIFILNVKIYIQ